MADAALTLIGRPFRLHGRDPATGLDCVGVVAAALEGAGFPASLPLDYTLRQRGAERIHEEAGAWGFCRTDSDLMPGDVMVIKVGPNQHHVAIHIVGGNFVHAHAGLRRVVLSPSPPDGRVVGVWRLQTSE